MDDQQYMDYLKTHIEGVQKAYDWIEQHLPDVHDKMNGEQLFLFRKHDDSKYSEEEFDPYNIYFYGGNKSHKVVKDFNYAWLHHIHNNPHHWQYWVLHHDDEPFEVLEMPYHYAIEMICDWWSFSFKKGNLYEIFDWYEKHKGMLLHKNTRKLVETTLKRIRDILDAEKESR